MTGADYLTYPKHKKESRHHFHGDGLRKVGDSNPRNGCPFAGLANLWFQPLTQLSFISFADCWYSPEFAIGDPFCECKYRKSDSNFQNSCLLLWIFFTKLVITDSEMNKTKILILCVCVLAAIFLSFMLLPAVSVAEGESEERLYLENGDVNALLDSINSKESIKCDFTLSMAIRLTSVFRTFKPGSYVLEDGMSTMRLVNKLVKGRQDPIKLTFNSVRTKEQLCSRLSQQLMLDSADIANVLRNDSILKAYGMDTLSVMSIFLPDTYEVYWNIKPNKLMDKFHNAYKAFWTAERKSKAEAAKITPFQATVLASIVDEESTYKPELPVIAGLYLNRLHIGMKLQADPTVKFATGDFSLRRITLEHINATRNNPYNTYTHIGLPPGMIRIPEKSTIDAVLNYEHHDYLFMCAKGNGEKGHNFTVTFGEHKQNATKYQQHLDKRNIH